LEADTRTEGFLESFLFVWNWDARQDQEVEGYEEFRDSQQLTKSETDLE